jgi:hypothetical protein
MKRIAAIAFLFGCIPVSAYGAVILAIDGNPAPDEFTMTLSSLISIGGISSDTSPYVAYLALLNPDTTERPDNTW